MLATQVSGCCSGSCMGHTSSCAIRLRQMHKINMSMMVCASTVDRHAQCETLSAYAVGTGHHHARCPSQRLLFGLMGHTSSCAIRLRQMHIIKMSVMICASTVDRHAHSMTLSAYALGTGHHHARYPSPRLLFGLMGHTSSCAIRLRQMHIIKMGIMICASTVERQAQRTTSLSAYAVGTISLTFWFMGHTLSRTSSCATFIGQLMHIVIYLR